MLRTIKIDKETLNHYNCLMARETVDYDAFNISRYSCVDRWTAIFNEGYEVDVKVCSNDKNEGIWCEAVLFQNGSECSTSDVEDALDGIWILYDGNKEFQVSVVAA